MEVNIDWTLGQFAQNGFPVDKLSDYEFTVGTTDKTFCYFKVGEMAITDFLLREGDQVDDLCAVKLIRSGETYSPRLKFWKRDKRKPAKSAAQQKASGEEVERQVKSSVDLDESHESFWQLIGFLQSCAEIELGPNEFTITTHPTEELANRLAARPKAESVEAIRQFLANKDLDKDDLNLILDRKNALQEFKSMLDDEAYFKAKKVELEAKGPEKTWQKFFEKNPWIFGYGLKLVWCDKLNENGLEQIVAGSSALGGPGKRADAAMVTTGSISNLLIAEMKHHETPLLRLYQEPDIYAPSRELSGATSQVAKTAHKTIRDAADISRVAEKDGTYKGEVSTLKPRQVVIIGSRDEFKDNDEINSEKVTAFELHREGLNDIEILTFDELYARAKFIVEADD